MLLVPEFVRYLGGDLPAAVILSQLFYWYRPDKNGQSKLRVMKFGSWWIAKSNKEWQQETGMTEKQVRRGLEVLAERGIISMATIRFNGAPTVHCRLVRLGGKRQVVRFPSEILEEQGQMDMPCGADGNALEVESLTENTAEKTTESFTQQAAGSTKEVKEDMADLKTILSGKKGNPQNLEVAWNKYVSQEYGGFQPKMTLKELAQVKRIRLWCESSNVDGVEFVRWCIETWSTMSSDVRVNAGLKAVPQVPNVSWLSQYMDHAVHLYKQMKDLAHMAAMDAPVGQGKVVEKHYGPGVDLTPKVFPGAAEAVQSIAEKSKPAKKVDLETEKPSEDQIAEAFAMFGKKG